MYNGTSKVCGTASSERMDGVAKTRSRRLYHRRGSYGPHNAKEAMFRLSSLFLGSHGFEDKSQVWQVGRLMS